MDWKSKRIRTLLEDAFALLRDAETKAATHFSNGATITCHKCSDFLWMIGSGPHIRVLGLNARSCSTTANWVKRQKITTRSP